MLSKRVEAGKRVAGVLQREKIGSFLYGFHHPEMVDSPDFKLREKFRHLDQLNSFTTGHSSRREDRLRKQLLAENWGEKLRVASAEGKLQLVNDVYRVLLGNPKANFSEEFPEIARQYAEFYAADPIHGEIDATPFKAYPGFSIRNKVIGSGDAFEHPIIVLRRFIVGEARQINAQLAYGHEEQQTES